MSEEIIELVKNKGDEKKYLDAVLDSDLIDFADEVGIDDTDCIDSSFVECTNLTIDPKGKCIDFSLVEEVRYKQIRHYRVDFSEVDFSNFFKSLVKDLDVNRLKKAIMEITISEELREKFYNFLQNKINELTNKEKDKLIKALIKCGYTTALKLLI